MLLHPVCVLNFLAQNWKFEKETRELRNKKGEVLDGAYKIPNDNSLGFIQNLAGKVLDLDGSIDSNDTPSWQDKDPSKDQKWRRKTGKPGCFVLIHNKSGKCLTGFDGKTTLMGKIYYNNLNTSIMF